MQAHEAPETPTGEAIEVTEHMRRAGERAWSVFVGDDGSSFRDGSPSGFMEAVYRAMETARAEEAAFRGPSQGTPSALSPTHTR